jgi:RND superfamily putative drug exporter
MQRTARSDTRLGKLAHFCYTRRRLVLVLWIIGLIAITFVSQAVGNKYANKFGSSNTESGRAQTLLAQRFPAAAGDTAQVVLHTTDPITAPANAAAIQALAASLQGLPHVTGVTSPLTPQGGAQLSPDGHTAYIAVQFDKLSSDLPLAAIKKVISVAEAARHPGFEVELGGPPIDLVDFAVPGKSEGIGIFAAMIVLLVAFGSVVAMGLPIIIALFGIGAGFGVLAVMSHFLNVPTFGPELAAMIGIGVGIDYALFIVTRYRNALHDGLEPQAAVELALTTSGRAVLFAGCTVVISLIGLMFMGQPFVIGLAVGAIASVLLVMAGTFSLLPALLGFCGRAIDKVSVFRGATRAKPYRETAAYRWSREIQRHPWAFGLASLLVLVTLAVPLFSMRQSFTDDGNAPLTLTTRHAYDLLAQGFGPGFNGPLVIAVDLPAGANPAVVNSLAAAVKASGDVAFVAPPRVNAAGNAAVIIAYPASSPEAKATTDLVNHLRQDVIPPVVQGTGASVLLGGFTAGGIDFAQTMTARLPLVIGLVVGLSFLLLMCVFRSVAVPIKAAVMNLLSIGAAYGVVVAVFQWGWLGSIFGVPRTGPVESFLPVMLFAILFGLSMDYQVFLVTRIHEEWLKSGDNAVAVRRGLAATGKTITAAALIMIFVFGSFVFGGEPVIKEFGLGLAGGILIDAVVIRMAIVPALMLLTGSSNWWFPGWLDRLLPRMGFEPEKGPAAPAGAGDRPAAEPVGAGQPASPP